jgi:imidazolonepropionase-like amidohydrolase
MRALLFVAVLAGVAGAEPLALTGATVHVKPGTTIDNATIVIDGGKITAVGAGVAVPAGAKVIDAKGKVITAGLIEGLSSVGLVGVELEASAVDGRFGPTDALHGDAVHASYEARDGFDPRDVGVGVARVSGGITTVIAAPAGGLIAGQSAAFTLDGSAEPVRAPAGMNGVVGADGGAAAGGSRGKAIEMLRELLDDARAYGRDKGAYERNAKRRLLADRLDLEALQPVLAGKLPFVVEAQSETDIRAVLRLAAKLKIKVAIIGGSEAWRVAPELAKAKVPVFVDPTANLPSSLPRAMCTTTRSRFSRRLACR